MKLRRILGLGVCLAAFCFANDAKRLSEAAERAEKAGDTLQAYLLYSRAAALDPSNLSYAQRIAALETSTALKPTPRYEPDPADETLDTAITAETATGRDYLEAQQAELPRSWPPRGRRRAST